MIKPALQRVATQLLHQVFKNLFYKFSYFRVLGNMVNPVNSEQEAIAALVKSLLEAMLYDNIKIVGQCKEKRGNHGPCKLDYTIVIKSWYNPEIGQWMRLNLPAESKLFLPVHTITYIEKNHSPEQ